MILCLGLQGLGPVRLLLGLGTVLHQLLFFYLVFRIAGTVPACRHLLSSGLRGLAGLLGLNFWTELFRVSWSVKRLRFLLLFLKINVFALATMFL